MNIGLIYEYENILIGQRNSFTFSSFNQSDDANEKSALELIKYAIETYLRWKPERVIKCLDARVINILQLDSIVKYVQFPEESDSSKDYYIIGLKLYPQYAKINFRDTTLMIYERVLTGALKKFPKGYMVGNQGNIRARICFQYVLTNYFAYMGITDLYDLFSSPKGRNVLKQYKLNAICTAMYKYPVDFLHDTLPDEIKNEFLYRYCKFCITNREQIREMKENETFLA